MWGQSPVKAKREFIALAMAEGVRVNIRELCRRFGISPTSAYALLKRYRVEGADAFDARSRRPRRSPTKTRDAVEAAVLELRDATHWGSRKISHVLRRDVDEAMPPRSTVHNILKRNGRITDEASLAAQPLMRFEHPEPNDLAQMDFMGRFATARRSVSRTHDGRRSLAFCSVPAGVCEPDARDRRAASDLHVRSVRAAVAHDDGSGFTLG